MTKKQDNIIGTLSASIIIGALLTLACIVY